MTTPSTARKAGPLLGNGSTTSFPFTFKVFAAADVAVTIANSSGVETVLVLNTDYSVSLNANQDTSPGGTITYPISGSALPVGSKISITGDIDYDQPLDLPSGGNFSPLALENQLDRATMQIQQLKEEVDRSAKLPVTNSEDPQALVADLVRLADSADNIDTAATNIASINTVADDLNEPVSEINTVATNIANVNTVGSNIANVNTVAGVSANVTTVAGISANVTTVAGIAANVTAVAGNATNINAVNANKTNIDTVAGVAANVTTVAGISADVTTVAGISADVAAVENIAANVTTVAGIAPNVTTVAGISANVTTVAGVSSDVTTVATNIAAVNTAATNIAAIIAAPSEAAAAAASAAAAAASAASGMYSAVQDKSADYTVVAADAGDLIRVDTSGGARTITLPAISTQSDGFKIAIGKWSGDANAVTIQRTGSDLINGSATYVLDAQYKSATFVADFQTNTWFAAGTGGGGTNILVDSFNGTGAQTAFTLSGDPGSENNTQVFVSGVYQEKDTYSVSGTTLTFSAAPPAGTSNIEVVWSIPLAIGTPSDGTVTTAKIVDSAVTAAKLASGAAVANIGYTPQQQDSELTTLAGMSSSRASYLASTEGFGFRNRIINGDMRINQRVYVSGATTTAGQYTLDRWKVTGTGGITFSTTANKTTVTIPSAQTIQQVIEGLNLDTGTYVLSWEGTAQGRIAGGSYGSSGSVTASITGGTNTTIEFNSGTVTNIQLETGTVATPFERRDYGRELMMCQRYYYKIFPQATNSMLATGYVNSSSTALLSGSFPVVMRTAPTALEQSGTAGNYRIVAPVGPADCSSVPTFSSNTNEYQYGVNFTVASGLTTGHGATGRTGSTTGASGYLAWSAEL